MDLHKVNILIFGLLICCSLTKQDQRFQDNMMEYHFLGKSETFVDRWPYLIGNTSDYKYVNELIQVKAGAIFSLYPRTCSGGCKGTRHAILGNNGHLIDFSIPVNENCPLLHDWSKLVENEKNTPCFEEERKTCSYCMPLRMWTNMRIHLRKECIYKPPKKCEKTPDLKNGKCSECKLFNRDGLTFTHNMTEYIKEKSLGNQSFQAWDITTKKDATTEL